MVAYLRGFCGAGWEGYWRWWSLWRIGVLAEHVVVLEPGLKKLEASAGFHRLRDCIVDGFGALEVHCPCSIRLIKDLRSIRQHMHDEGVDEHTP